MTDVKEYQVIEEKDERIKNIYGIRIVKSGEVVFRQNWVRQSEGYWYMASEFQIPYTNGELKSFVDLLIELRRENKL